MRDEHLYWKSNGIEEPGGGVQSPERVSVGQNREGCSRSRPGRHEDQAPGKPSNVPAGKAHRVLQDGQPARSAASGEDSVPQSRQTPFVAGLPSPTSLSS